jgi:predicted nucleic-acid-binding Zn-ribbon protein
MTQHVLCPKCLEKELTCGYDGDVGTIEYEDQYHADCSACGFSETKTVSGGSPLNMNYPTNCPYCGKEYCSNEDLAAK